MNLLHLAESDVKMKRMTVDKTVDRAKQPEAFQLFLQIRKAKAKARVVLSPTHLLILPRLLCQHRIMVYKGDCWERNLSLCLFLHWI